MFSSRYFWLRAAFAASLILGTAAPALAQSPTGPAPAGPAVAAPAATEPAETEPAVTPAADGTAPVGATEAAPSETTPEPTPVAVGPAAEKVAAEEKPGVTFTAEPGSGATFDAGDTFSLNVKTRIQLRYQLEIHAPDETGERALDQTVNVGTARLFFGGHVFSRDLRYLIQLAIAGRDYREGATSPIYDAFVDWKGHRDLSIKAGQYFVPFDRLRTVREFALQMADRPRPVQELTLDRDVGVTAYSDSFLGDQSPLAYRLGVFGGGGTNLSLGKTPGALVVGRLELRPFGAIDDDSEGDLKRRAEPGLALGVAGAVNWNTNRLRSTTGRTFAADVVDYYHGAIDLVFKWRGLALQGEVLVKGASRDELEGAVPGTPEYSQSGKGWIVQASYLFDPPVEVVGRLSRLYANETTDPAFVALVESGGQEVGAGLNYYLNGHKFKLQADWIARMPPGFVFDRAEQVAHAQFDITL